MRLKRLPLGALLTLLVLAMAWATWHTVRWSESRAYDRLATQGRDRLVLYGGALHSELERSANIPLVLANDPEVTALLAAPAGDPRIGALVAGLNRRLRGMNLTLGASAIYLLDRAGLTLAASNWDEGPGSFVGQRFDFRPYFLAAMGGSVGRYFALGTTSGIPGYYLAVPVTQEGVIFGAVVVKMSLEELERGWSGGGEKVFVTDRLGIVFVTNIQDWRFHSLAPLDKAAVKGVLASRQYGEMPPAPLGLAVGKVLTALGGEDYVMVSQPLADGDGWTLHVLLGVREAKNEARTLGLLAVAAISLTILGAYFVVHRNRLQRHHTHELELRVAERTEALLSSNQRLTAEVIERQRAEVELKAKQEELVQAAKWAALGQMSAGMAHEINQPLAAIRTYADNAMTLLGLGRTDTVRDNLVEIGSLTERMARITGQLNQFSRKSTGDAAPVALVPVIEAALALLAGRLRGGDIELDWSPPADEVWVWGDDVRLQQVLINLLRNALDAIQGASVRRLGVAVNAGPETITLSVADSGPGIASEVLPQLFDPFFTTKPAGEGLGLGLSISDGIVREMGGQLTGANRTGGGAVFTITLRRAGVA